MKIANVTNSVSRTAGGLFFSVRSLCQSLANFPGLNVSIYGLEDCYTAEDLDGWLPLKPEIFPIIGPNQIGFSPRMKPSILSGAFDVVHTQGIWQGPSAAVHGWHSKTKRPYLISPRGMLDPWALANSRWKKRIAAAWYESAHLRDAACIHALCQSEAESIRAYGLKNPVCVIPNGVDLVDAETLKTETLKGERKTLLFLGRLHPKKGLANALRAWGSHSKSKIQNSKFHEWQFVVAGWDQGGHEVELKRLCDELGLAYADVPAAEFVGETPTLLESSSVQSVKFDEGFQSASSSMSAIAPTVVKNSFSVSVIFTGPAFGDAKDALLRQADAFILPSFSEGLPMSVLEAWSYWLPVLMTDHCNLPEGFAAEAAIRIGTDVESITEGMRSLFQSQTSDRRSLGANGRALVERQFTWPQVAAQMKEVYEWVLGGGEVPDCVRQF